MEWNTDNRRPRDFMGSYLIVLSILGTWLYALASNGSLGTACCNRMCLWSTRHGNIPCSWRCIKPAPPTVQMAATVTWRRLCNPADISFSRILETNDGNPSAKKPRRIWRYPIEEIRTPARLEPTAKCNLWKEFAEEIRAFAFDYTTPESQWKIGVHFIFYRSKQWRISACMIYGRRRWNELDCSVFNF